MLKGVLFDLDGTLYMDGVPLGGALALIERLKKKEIPLAFVTNTTSKTRQQLFLAMREMGFALEQEQIITPIASVVHHLKKSGIRKIAVEYCPEIEEEFSAFEFSEKPEAVILADDGNGLPYEAVNRVVNYYFQGAKLFTLQKNKYYARNGTYAADLGFYTSGFEYVLSTNIENFGKPSPALFAFAAEKLGCSSLQEIAMVGDDLEFDVVQPTELGLYGVLVKTGKFREETLQKSAKNPLLVIDSLQQFSLF